VIRRKLTGIVPASPVSAEDCVAPVKRRYKPMAINRQIRQRGLPYDESID
jgi:hypothetical protein